jgi:hypothetical protein
MTLKLLDKLGFRVTWLEHFPSNWQQFSADKIFIIQDSLCNLHTIYNGEFIRGDNYFTGTIKYAWRVDKTSNVIYISTHPAYAANQATQN